MAKKTVKRKTRAKRAVKASRAKTSGVFSQPLSALQNGFGSLMNYFK
jgi:hypothetical protein